MARLAVRGTFSPTGPRRPASARRLPRTLGLAGHLTRARQPEITMTTYRDGGCLCGSVRFRAEGRPMRTLVCHCRFCQRVTGSTSYAESMYPIDSVQFSGAAMAQYSHTSEGSSKQVHVHFCSKCSTALTLTFERWPEYRAISRGSFDDPNSVAIGSHIWVSSAQTGVVLPAETECFQFARASLDGTPQNPVRHAAPQLARSEAS